MNKILYVVGAGASAEAKLLVGNELKNNIRDYLSSDDYGDNVDNVDEYIARAIQSHARESSEDISFYSTACTQISLSMPLSLSIDNYIHTHRDNIKIELCGKLAIARSILEAEKESLLYVDRHEGFDLNSLNSTWYISFFQLLTENCTKEELSERLKSISLIVFNYDRCIEHFLYNAFKTYYLLTDEEAASFVNEIEIYHPYGVVGNLPWQNKDTAVDYGEEVTSHLLLEIANKLKTFTEGVNPDSSDITAIHHNVHNADKIVFLGFSFHPLNMKLMSPIEKEFGIIDKDTKYFATTYGISLPDQRIIQDKLKGFTSRVVRKIELEGHKSCSGLFQKYWRSLSFN